MITFTEAARGRVLELLAGEGRQSSALRFSISGRMGGVFQYRLAFMKPEERDSGDVLADAGGFQVVVEARSAPHLAGTAMDYVEARICETLPQVKEVVDATDHTGGANPCFRGSESRESPFAWVVERRM